MKKHHYTLLICFSSYYLGTMTIIGNTELNMGAENLFSSKLTALIKDAYQETDKADEFK